MPSVRYDNHSLIVDEKRVQIVSGAVHYFRIPRGAWRDRIEKCVAGGLNTIETYVPWNVHEYQKGMFRFDGNRDLEAFLGLCASYGLYTIVRPSPYICAEWDNGGLPAWLAAEPNIAYRRANSVYLRYIERWYHQLLPVIKRNQWTMGGSIILVQVENEYGYFNDANDVSYMTFLLDVMKSEGIDVPFITCDLPGVGEILPGAVKTANFGSRFREGLAVLRDEQPDAFLFVCELWLAWFDHYGGHHHQRPGREVANALKEVLAAGGHYNFYMWSGGTNFGYFSGRTTTGEEGAFITTSYDYDAPIGETGNVTDKYRECRLVNLLASTWGEMFAASDEVETRYTTATPDVRVTERQSEHGRVLYIHNQSERPQYVALAHPQFGRYPSTCDWQFQPGETRVFYRDVTVTRRVHILSASVEVLARVVTHPDVSREEMNCPNLVLITYVAEGETAEFELDVDGQRVVRTVRPTTVDEVWRERLGDVEIVVVTRDMAKRIEVRHANGHGIWNIEPVCEERTCPTWRSASLSFDSADVISHLAERQGQSSPVPCSMESLGILHGYAWYKTRFESDGSETGLVLQDVRDRATVFLNGVPQGTVGRFGAFGMVPIQPLTGSNELLLLVDNLARYNFTSRLGQPKGFLGAAYLDAKHVTADEWTVSSVDGVERGDMTISARMGTGLYLRVSMLDGPVQFELDGTCIYQHRSIGDDDTWFEIDVTDWMKSDFPRLSYTRAMTDSTQPKPRVQAVSYDLLQRLSGDYQVFAGIAGEGTDVEIDDHVFEELSFHPHVDTPSSMRPTLYRAQFSRLHHPKDAALKIHMDGLGKGVVWLNGKSLGRYWSIGPQRALYVPTEWMQDENTLYIFDEFGQSPHGLHFSDCESFV